MAFRGAALLRARDLVIPSYGMLRKQPLFSLEIEGFKPYFFGNNFVYNSEKNV